MLVRHRENRMRFAPAIDTPTEAASNSASTRVRIARTARERLAERPSEGPGEHRKPGSRGVRIALDRSVSHRDARYAKQGVNGYSRSAK
jgi:hypothetical protein